MSGPPLLEKQDNTGPDYIDPTEGAKAVVRPVPAFLYRAVILPVTPACLCPATPQ